MTCHDWKTNLRLLSVQAGLIGGALTAALGSYKAYADLVGLTLTVPDWLFAAAGVLTAAGVFFGRLIPQPNVPSDGGTQ